jgi:hypothetical protein
VHMSSEIDSYIDSDSFSDQGLLSMLGEGKRLSSLTLVRYLSKGVVHPSECYSPKAEVIRELLHAGASPFHYSQRHEWEVLFQDDIRAYMPQPLRSTLNLAALIHDRAIMDLLVKAGEESNMHTEKFLKNC